MHEETFRELGRVPEEILYGRIWFDSLVPRQRKAHFTLVRQ
jgi:hypothetical protein